MFSYLVEKGKQNFEKAKLKLNQIQKCVYTFIHYLCFCLRLFVKVNNSESSNTKGMLTSIPLHMSLSTLNSTYLLKLFKLATAGISSMGIMFQNNCNNEHYLLYYTSTENPLFTELKKKMFR